MVRIQIESGRGDGATAMVEVRPYRWEGRDAVRRLAFSCADPRALPECLRERPDAEPKSRFVAVDARGRVVGYIVGAVSTAQRDRWVGVHGLPGLALRGILLEILFRRPVGRMVSAGWHSWRRSRAAERSLEGRHSAHPHIGVREDVRGFRIGRRLLARFSRHVALREPSEIHASVIASNEAARSFFLGQGFREPSQYQTVFPGRAGEVPMILFGEVVSPARCEACSGEGTAS